MKIGRVRLGVLFALAATACANGGTSSSSATAEPAKAIDVSVQSPNMRPQVVFYPRVGNVDDDEWGATGPGLVLMNDALGPTAAFTWMHATVDRTRIAGDVVVLCTHCADVYSGVLYQLAPFNSVQTVLVPPQSKMSDIDLVADRLKTAEIVLLSDGDLSSYMTWGATPLGAAVQDVYDRSGVVAGAGAGARALGWAVLTSQTTSSLALGNPYDPSITLARGPLRMLTTAGLYVDLATESTDRFGVLAAMTARSINDGLADTVPSDAIGIGLDVNAALAFDHQGSVTLLSDDGSPGAAWIVHGASADQIASGRPLLWSGVEVTRFDAPGESYRLSAGCGTAFSYKVTIDGATSPPFAPADPYEAAGVANPCN